MDFTDKVAIVTGGAGGIGEATALRFAQAKAAVMVVDIHGDAADAVAKCITQSGGRAKSFQADLTTAKAANEMVEATLSSFGRIDCAFNNVGGSLPGSEAPLHEIDFDLFERDLRLNLYSALHCVRAEIPHMLAQKRGAIVNTSSLAGLGGSMSNASYTVGKHGVIGLTKNAAIAYGPQGIRVNAICPGSIETPTLEANFSGIANWRELLSHAALERMGQPLEVANLVVWLCSDEASFMSGAAIPIDGGTSAFAVRVGSSRKKN